MDSYHYHSNHFLEDDQSYMDRFYPNSELFQFHYDNNDNNYESTDKSQQNISSTMVDQEGTANPFSFTPTDFELVVKPQNANNLLKKRAHIQRYDDNYYQNEEDDKEKGCISFTESYNTQEDKSTNSTTVALRNEYESNFHQNFLDRTQRFLKNNKRFYLYLDLVVDLDFFQNYSDKQNYLVQKKHFQIEKGLRYVNQVVHRMDNKFIEVDMTFFPSNVNDIEYLLKILYSYGNQDLLQTINKLQSIWKNIQIMKEQIFYQAQDPLFTEHVVSRKLASNQRFIQLTENMNKEGLIFYIRLSVNYEKMLFESDRVGYSPELYELIAENSYAFKEYIQTYGYFDPRNTVHKMEQCINTTLFFLTNSLKPFFQNEGQNYSVSTAEIKTIDKFTFPVSVKSRFFNLNQEYDQQNNLDFKFNDILVTYEYEFQDQITFEDFKNYRKQQQAVESRPVTIYNDEDIDDRFDYKKSEFFKKYYDDQVDNLLTKGNKWYKKCGFIPIPSKKTKKNSDQ